MPTTRLPRGTGDGPACGTPHEESSLFCLRFPFPHPPISLVPTPGWALAPSSTLGHYHSQLWSLFPGVDPNSKLQLRLPFLGCHLDLSFLSALCSCPLFCPLTKAYKVKPQPSWLSFFLLVILLSALQQALHELWVPPKCSTCHCRPFLLTFVHFYFFKLFQYIYLFRDTKLTVILFSGQARLISIQQSITGPLHPVPPSFVTGVDTPG